MNLFRCLAVYNEEDRFCPDQVVVVIPIDATLLRQTRS